MTYRRFAAMIATSTVVMFILMYLNTYALDHVFFSETRVYMAILMGATMAVIMLGFMFSMYENKALNVGMFAGAAIIFAISLWLVRSQATVGQVSYMRAMIPHHSIAIMTSKRAQITDPRVRKLADEIIAAQQREIAEMRYLIASLEEGEGPAALGHKKLPGGGAGTSITPSEEAIERAIITRTDPAMMNEAEIETVLEPGPHCSFSLTRSADPILVVASAEAMDGRSRAVTKLHGRLVALQVVNGRFETLLGGASVIAQGLAMQVGPLEGRVEPGSPEPAELHFRLEEGLEVGYRGFYSCTG